PGRIDDDERDAARVQARDLLLGELGDDEDQAGAAPSGDAVDPRAPERARTFLGGEHDAEAVLAGDLLDALDDLHRPWALELVEHDVEQMRPRLTGRAAVAVLLEQGLDARPRAGRDVVATVDPLGHRRDRAPGGIRDVRDRHATRTHGAKVSRFEAVSNRFR